MTSQRTQIEATPMPDTYAGALAPRAGASAAAAPPTPISAHLTVGPRFLRSALRRRLADHWAVQIDAIPDRRSDQITVATKLP